MRISHTAALLAITAIGAPLGADLLPLLNDEFDAPSLGDYKRVMTEEGWPNDQLEVLDVGTTRAGWLTLVPYTNGWYEDYRGPLVFKEVSGDFVVTTSVEVSNRAGTAAPGREYSLAGIMVRAPRAITPLTWTAGLEKYTFLSIGAANLPGTFQYEVKSTSNEDELPAYSQLDISASDCSCGETLIQTARIGIYVIQLAKTSTGPWRVVNRYRRPDLPALVQVGFVAYTNWEIVQNYPVAVHNETTITTAYLDPGTPSEPDIRAQFDYIHFLTPAVPAEFVGVDLANPAMVSDIELLSFLGANAASTGANVPAEVWLSM